MGKFVDGMGVWAWLGLVPTTGAAIGIVLLVAGRRRALVGVCCISAVVVQVVMLGWATDWLNPLKASRDLIASAGAFRRDRDVRLANCEYFPPSLVFYGQRLVQSLHTDQEVIQFLANPIPGYLFVIRRDWEGLRGRHPEWIGEPVARHWDMYRNCEVVVVSNQSAKELALRP
jgi:hypothetical protein